jgi:hypothetical protein
MNNTQAVPLKDQVTTVTANLKSFLDNYKPILEGIPKQNKDYISQLLDLVQAILLNKSVKCNPKFFSLFLITKITETKNPEFVAQLATRKDLLNQLETEATFDKDKDKDRGVSFFNPKPSDLEASMGKNYIRLLIESIKFWSEQFGGTDPKKPEYIFKTLCEKLKAAKVKFGTDNLVIGKTPEQVLQPKGAPKTAVPAGQTQPPAQQKPAPQPKPQPIAVPKVDANKLIIEVKEALEMIANARVELKPMIEQNEQEDPNNDELLEFYMTEYITNPFKTVQKATETIYDIQHPEVEKVTAQVFEESTSTGPIVEAYPQYKNKKLKWSVFRQKLLGWANAKFSTPGAPETPGGPEVVQITKVEEIKVDEVVVGDDIRAQVSDTAVSEFVPRPAIKNHEAQKKSALGRHEEETKVVEKKEVFSLNLGGAGKEKIEIKETGFRKASDRIDSKDKVEKVEIVKEKIEIKPVIVVKEEPPKKEGFAAKMFSDLKSDVKAVEKKFESKPKEEKKEEKKEVVVIKVKEEKILKNEDDEFEDVEIDVPVNQSKGKGYADIKPVEKRNFGSVNTNTEMRGSVLSGGKGSSMKSYEPDLQIIESSIYKMRGSHFKTSDLSSISNSIKSTFKNIGRKAVPEYEGLSELQIREKLEKENVEIARERDYYRSEYELLRVKFEDSKVFVGSDIIEDYDRKIKYHESQIGQLKAQNDKYKTQLAKKELEVTKSPEFIKIQQENNELRGQIELIKTGSPTVPDKAVVTADQADLKTKLKELQMQNQSLTSTLQDLKSKNTTLSTKVTELEELQNSTINANKYDDNMKSVRGTGVQKTETVNVKDEKLYYDLVNQSPFKSWIFEPGRTDYAASHAEGGDKKIWTMEDIKQSYGGSAQTNTATAEHEKKSAPPTTSYAAADHGTTSLSTVLGGYSATNGYTSNYTASADQHYGATTSAPAYNQSPGGYTSASGYTATTYGNTYTGADAGTYGGYTGGTSSYTPAPAAEHGTYSSYTQGGTSYTPAPTGGYTSGGYTASTTAYDPHTTTTYDQHATTNYDPHAATNYGSYTGGATTTYDPSHFAGTTYGNYTGATTTDYGHSYGTTSYTAPTTTYQPSTTYTGATSYQAPTTTYGGNTNTYGYTSNDNYGATTTIPSYSNYSYPTYTGTTDVVTAAPTTTSNVHANTTSTTTSKTQEKVKSSGVHRDSPEQYRFDEKILKNLSSQKKDVKGTLVEAENSMLLEMGNVMSQINGLAYFKLACLKNKCPIYEDSLLQIGCVTNVVRDQDTQRNHLKLTLYFGNKTDDSIRNLGAELIKNDAIQAFCKPDRLESTLAPQAQQKLQIVTHFLRVPFTSVQMDCSAKTSYEETNFRLYLPTTINKLMEFKFTDGDEFRSKWHRPNTKVVKTSEIVLDQNIAKTLADFKQYFTGLIELKPKSDYDKKNAKLAGCFELDVPGVEYLVKIVTLPNGNVVFQIAAPSESVELAAFLLQTLGFLFRN